MTRGHPVHKGVVLGEHRLGHVETPPKQEVERERKKVLRIREIDREQATETKRGKREKHNKKGKRVQSKREPGGPRVSSLRGASAARDWPVPQLRLPPVVARSRRPAGTGRFVAATAALGDGHAGTDGRTD